MKNERKLPAYPLFVKDPNYSLWSVTEELNKSNVQSWWGEEKRIYGFLKTHGKTYCFLGNGADFAGCGVINAEQQDFDISAFTTDYTFKAENTTLKIKFVSPLIPDDLEMISLPVCYLEYEIEGDKNAELSIFVSRDIASNASTVRREVRGGVVSCNGFESAFFGLKKQLPLSNNGDTIGADWGYWYLAGEESFFANESNLVAYLAGGYKSFTNTGEERFLCTMNQAQRGVVLLGYDDIVSIDYFGDFRKGYYLQKHTIFEGLETVWKNYRSIDKRLAEFDGELKRKARPFGEEYLNILYASLRQSISSHKLIADSDGKILFLSKECGSNGCIATVDITYPSSPLFLLYNSELIKGMMRPIVKFARMPVWKYDFAPHDAGTYPHCCGHVYGFNQEKSKYLGNLIQKTNEETWYPYYLLPANYDVYDLKDQMPVEECANLLIMWYACYHRDGDITFFAENADLAEKWVQYLIRNGLKPEEQLCTDDFAGHLKNNLNLAIKATVGIACYSKLIEAMGKSGQAAEYRKTAEKFAKEIFAFANQFSHLPISWDTDENTYSLKYNFAFDKILGLGLFEQDILERETDYYLQKANKFGTPLDGRATYTKSDWLSWTAALTDSKEKQNKILAQIDYFLKESPYRAPFSDWYDTNTGCFRHFRARTVQGGCFALLLRSMLFENNK
ncbi:MAG: DUF4965 domain-containing protein [Lachnospiraceae bacterium]|nr:DUF4965 domain-containing protein [Lachnospiraceae bacterium]